MHDLTLCIVQNFIMEVSTMRYVNICGITNQFICGGEKRKQKGIVKDIWFPHGY